MTNYSIEEKYELIRVCLLKSKSANPLQIIREIMHKDFINIHGPEHHLLDGGAFMTALFNVGMHFDLEKGLQALAERSIKMPGAMCGYWGMCGSVASLSAVFSILHNVGPLSDTEFYSDDMEFSSRVIKKMSEIGGPRCCKRNAFLSISTAIAFAKEKYGIELDTEDIHCEFSNKNLQCIKDRCPFYHN